MFNSLQEGIIVIQGPDFDEFDETTYKMTKDQVTQCRITFINDLGTRIFKQINGIKEHFSEDVERKKNPMSHKIFFQYKQK